MARLRRVEAHEQCFAFDCPYFASLVVRDPMVGSMALCLDHYEGHQRWLRLGEDEELVKSFTRGDVKSA